MVSFTPALAETFSGVNGLIFFSSDKEGPLQDVFFMNPDGTNQTRLTFEPINVDFIPSLSPDGTKIAFSSLRDGNFEIYVMNAVFSKIFYY